MGLDAVEFIIAVEESFEVDIPNEVAARLITPRDVIDYLVSELPSVAEGPCLSQRTFYRLRAALTASAPQDGARAIGLDTELDALVPRAGRAEAWHRVQSQLGAANFPGPPVQPDWLGRLQWWRPRRVRDVVRHVVAYAPRAMLGTEGWTRSQITAVITRLCEEEFGVDMRRFSLDSEFVRDMGVD